MKPLLLLTLTLTILTYSQKTGGGRGSKVTTTTKDGPITRETDRPTEEPRNRETDKPTEEPRSRETVEPTPARRRETDEPTDEPTDRPTTDTDTHTYAVGEPTSNPTTPPPTWPIDATVESCALLSYTTKTCSCGTMCSSYSREYFGVCWGKCGEQILKTGEFGKEECDLNDFFAKDMSKNYTMMVLDCENGEFAFEDTGFRMNIGLISLIVMGVYLFVH